MLEAVSARDIAVTGLRAQRTRMNIIAQNIANAMSPVTAKGGAFRRQMAVLEADQISPITKPDKFGVRVKQIASDPSPLRRVFEPNNPIADADGYVEYPNIDLSVEMVDLVSAQRAYEANVAVVLSSKRISQKALDILQV
ncbi:MAG: flagellar basal body rod protein FlgC [Candidatus Hydrogenedentes bacterium]|nr:flagellar basal body rod protein FlgC [Candidatus Hydrogenedentota bacterium]